jgi:hypothetical protein
MLFPIFNTHIWPIALAMVVLPCVGDGSRNYGNPLTLPPPPPAEKINLSQTAPMRL